MHVFIHSRAEYFNISDTSYTVCSGKSAIKTLITLIYIQAMKNTEMPHIFYYYILYPGPFMILNYDTSNETCHYKALEIQRLPYVET